MFDNVPPSVLLAVRHMIQSEEATTRGTLDGLKDIRDFLDSKITIDDIHILDMLDVIKHSLSRKLVTLQELYKDVNDEIELTVDGH